MPDIVDAYHVSDKMIIRNLLRAAAGALVFSLPMLMTMEMWEIGFYMDKTRLALLLLIQAPLLLFVAHYAGFEETFDWREDARDVGIAYGIAIFCSVLFLWLFGVIDGQTTAMEGLGQVMLQTVPASLGALLARAQFGRHSKQAHGARNVRFAAELMLMAVGALFLGLNVAPTEEMILISYRISVWQSLGLIGVSVAIMYGFVYAVSFRGGTQLSPKISRFRPFMRYTVTGYAIALTISLYLLWTFDRLSGLGLHEVIRAMIVLGFPCALGAAAARIIL